MASKFSIFSKVRNFKKLAGSFGKVREWLGWLERWNYIHLTFCMFFFRKKNFCWPFVDFWKKYFFLKSSFRNKGYFGWKKSFFFDSVLDRRILTKNMNFSPKISLYFWTNFSKQNIFFKSQQKVNKRFFFEKKMYKMLNGCSFTSPTTPSTPQPSPLSHINF